MCKQGTQYSLQFNVTVMALSCVPTVKQSCIALATDTGHSPKCHHVQSPDWAKGCHMWCGSRMAVTKLSAKSTLHFLPKVLAAVTRLGVHCSWARPVSASLTAEDCRPPDRAHMIEDLSSIEDDESPGWRYLLCQP